MKVMTMRLALVLAFLAGFPAILLADGEEDDQSPAGKEYREGWWAETGAGNLTEALDRYAKAVAAEGPASIRARALYRRAVVLQRIGKTEDALRALERLSKDFPGEAKVLEEAKKRLEEWTAVDLRTSFGEWYRRFQYSPEFQAKIVDLVLSLGKVVQWVVTPEENELLTIGEPVLPALREHLGSANDFLRERAVRLLLQLGEVPPGAALSRTTWWAYRAESWRRIFALPAERRAALGKEAHGDSEMAQALRAATAGKMAALEWLLTEEPQHVYVEGPVALVTAIFEEPVDAAVLDRAKALPTSRETEPQVAQRAARTLLLRGRVTPEQALAWLDVDSQVVRLAVLEMVQGVELRSPGAWKAVADFMRRVGKPGGPYSIVPTALRSAIEFGMEDADVDGAADAVLEALGLGWNLEGRPEYPRFREVLAVAVERAKEPKEGNAALWNLTRYGGLDAQSVLRMVGWAASSPHSLVRASAAKAAAKWAGPETLDAVVGLFRDPRRLEERYESLVSGLMDAGIGRLPWTRAHLETLVDVAATRWSTSSLQFFGQLAQAEDRRRMLLDLGLERPERLSAPLWGVLLDLTPDAEAWVAKAFQERWGAWSSEQRRAALARIAGKVGVAPGSPLAAFLRERLRAPNPTASREDRAAALRFVSPITLENVRSVYDLRDAAQAEEALELLGQLPESPEVFEAFAVVLRPDGSADHALTLANRFGHVEPVQTALARRLLAHHVEGVRVRGLAVLERRSMVEDVPLVVGLLADPASGIRARAAAYLGRVYDKSAVAALARALDDPNPTVRDAVLAALDAIKKIEEQKAYWQKYAAGK